MKIFLPLLLALGTAGCGYHVAGHADLMPKNVQTIAIPAFGNLTTGRAKLSRLITADVSREFMSRTHYTIVTQPEQADAVLVGVLSNFNSFPIISDPVSGRSTGIQVVAVLQVTLTDRHTGKTIFSRPTYEYRERYEVTLDPQTYFDESGTAIERLSRDIARSVVTAILENF
jgi:outer membrane lipopolysaccharide assembly protein LptE/RlpB